jgi:hypothetical protein
MEGFFLRDALAPELAIEWKRFKLSPVRYAAIRNPQTPSGGFVAPKCTLLCIQSGVLSVRTISGGFV